jgi:hypothetical protein
MDHDEASRLISEVDVRDHNDRAERLSELVRLLPDDDMIGFSGQPAQCLFEDVKATWLYGCFTSTVLTAYAFCFLQLAGWMRWLPDNPDIPDEADNLEHLASLAAEQGLIDVDIQAHVVQLQDRYCSYTDVRLHQYDARLERHLIEADSLTDEDAVRTATKLLYTRS